MHQLGRSVFIEARHESIQDYGIGTQARYGASPFISSSQALIGLRQKVSISPDGDFPPAGLGDRPLDFRSYMSRK